MSRGQTDTVMLNGPFNHQGGLLMSKAHHCNDVPIMIVML